MRFVTSDHHFGHENILDLEDRPFDSVSDMEEKLAARWNEVVSPSDVVYHLGDMCYQDATTHEYWNDRLNGSLILVEGNHDYVEPEVAEFPVVQSCAVTSSSVMFALQHENFNWDSDKWLIHGHTHSNTKALCRHNNMVNVSVEVTNYYPVPLQLISEEIYYGGHGDKWTWEWDHDSPVYQ